MSWDVCVKQAGRRERKKKWAGLSQSSPPVGLPRPCCPGYYGTQHTQRRLFSFFFQEGSIEREQQQQKKNLPFKAPPYCAVLFLGLGVVYTLS